MVVEKTKLRTLIKENDNEKQKRIREITTFYEDQLSSLRKNNDNKEKNLINMYDGEINILREIIEAKEQEIERILQLNADIKQNEENRLNSVK